MYNCTTTRPPRERYDTRMYIKHQPSRPEEGSTIDGSEAEVSGDARDGLLVEHDGAAASGEVFFCPHTWLQDRHPDDSDGGSSTCSRRSCPTSSPGGSTTCGTTTYCADKYYRTNRPVITGRKLRDALSDGYVWPPSPRATRRTGTGRRPARSRPSRATSPRATTSSSLQGRGRMRGTDRRGTSGRGSTRGGAGLRCSRMR